MTFFLFFMHNDSIDCIFFLFLREDNSTSVGDQYRVPGQTNNPMTVPRRGDIGHIDNEKLKDNRRNAMH
jgi:hypothetical protein